VTSLLQIRRREASKITTDAAEMPPEELAETWRCCSPRLLLIARAVGEPAEDAVQEAFLQLSRQSPTPADPFAWLVTVTRNQLLQWRRSGDRRRKREHSDPTRVWFECQTPRLDDALDAKNVTDALGDLAPEQREIIVMHLWGEMSFSSIAELMSTSRSTVHRTFQSGIQAMRQRFDTETNPAPKVVIHE